MVVMHQVLSSLFASCVLILVQMPALAGMVDIYQDSEFRVQYETTATDVWQRQPIIVRVQVQSRDPYITLKLPDLHGEGLDLVPIPVQRHRPDHAGNQPTVFELGWIIVPLLGSTGTLKLPDMQLERGGALERSFTLPELKYKARALPPYVSPLIPVGRIQIMDQVDTTSLLDTDTLTFWKIRIRSQTIPAAWFPPLLRRVQDSAQIEFLPAEIRRESRPDIRGFNAEVEYLVPLKLKTSGWTKLPDIRLQYFDPQSGKLENVYLPPRKLFALGWPWRIAAGMLVLLLFIVVVLKGLRFTRRRYLRWSMHRRALRTIRDARELADLRTGLSQFARAEGWPENLGLHAWHDYWQSRYTRSDLLRNALHETEVTSYSGRSTIPVEDIVQKCHQALCTRRRKPSSHKQTSSAFQAILPDLYIRP